MPCTSPLCQEPIRPLPVQPALLTTRQVGPMREFGQLFFQKCLCSRLSMQCIARQTVRQQLPQQPALKSSKRFRNFSLLTCPPLGRRLSNILGSKRNNFHPRACRTCSVAMTSANAVRNAIRNGPRRKCGTDLNTAALVRNNSSTSTVSIQQNAAWIWGEVSQNSGTSKTSSIRGGSNSPLTTETPSSAADRTSLSGTASNSSISNASSNE